MVRMPMHARGRPIVPGQPEDQRDKLLVMFRRVKLVRGMLLRMHQAGIGKLKVGEVPLQTFLRMNPDENNNLLRVFQSNRATIHNKGIFAALQCPASRVALHGVLLGIQWCLGQCRL